MAESLGKLGDAAVTPLLLAALAGSNLAVQCSAIQTLGYLEEGILQASITFS